MPAKTKKCGKCKKRKPLDQFYWKNKAKGTRHSYCKACCAKRHRSYYQENKAYYRDKKVRNRRKLAEAIDELKKQPCADCGREYPPCVMDFDHVDGEKVAAVSKLKWNGQVTKVMKEIAKCEVVCANCHRIRTHNRVMVVVAQR